MSSWNGKSALEREYEEKAARRRAVNLRFAENGVVFFDLDQAFIDEAAVIGAGSYIGPAVVVTGSCVIGENCVIEQGSHIENCAIKSGARIDHSVLKDSEIGADTTVGPFAYVRPNSRIGDRCRIGDYVEIKNSVIGDDTKVSHLTYIGDADLGERINIGCGVVFVNYDGRQKHRSAVGDGVFIGCNVNLVSPVTIGAGAYIAAGGTVTRDVPPGALHVARVKDCVNDGWALRSGLLRSRAGK